MELDTHRGMAAQKATEDRRHTAEVEADRVVLRQHQDDLEGALSSGPAATWEEAGLKAHYLITVLAGTSEGQDPRYKKLIASALEDIQRLSGAPESEGTPKP
ncbi:hypothetical protein N826_35205 [Skermanella aerolata KACC 11604]|nr:hypothetical protein N826_35205 [Skermanella aerolata KACC 11604]